MSVSGVSSFSNSNWIIQQQSQTNAQSTTAGTGQTSDASGTQGMSGGHHHHHHAQSSSDSQSASALSIGSSTSPLSSTGDTDGDSDGSDPFLTLLNSISNTLTQIAGELPGGNSSGSSSAGATGITGAAATTGTAGTATTAANSGGTNGGFGPSSLFTLLNDIENTLTQIAGELPGTTSAAGTTGSTGNIAPTTPATGSTGNTASTDTTSAGSQTANASSVTSTTGTASGDGTGISGHHPFLSMLNTIESTLLQIQTELASSATSNTAATTQAGVTGVNITV